MSALLLMDVKHKLETGQDIFRAKTVRALIAEIDALKAENRKYPRAIELIRAAKPTGGMVVEYYKGRTLREWMTEFLAEVDGKMVTK